MASHGSNGSARGRPFKPGQSSVGRPFKPGQSGNPGGRPTRTRAEYEAISFATITPARWKRICVKAAQDAEKGDPIARAFVAKILGAEAATRVESKVETRVAFTTDVHKILADPDATTRLLDAVQGQVVRVPEADDGPH